MSSKWRFTATDRKVSRDLQDVFHNNALRLILSSAAASKELISGGYSNA